MGDYHLPTAGSTSTDLTRDHFFSSMVTGQGPTLAADSGTRKGARHRCFNEYSGKTSARCCCY